MNKTSFFALTILFFVSINLNLLNAKDPDKQRADVGPVRVTILIDNYVASDSNLCGEEGFSAVIEADGKKIVFDTGTCGNFVSNAHKLGIDLKNLDCIAISHSHNDHVGGIGNLIEYLKQFKVKPVFVMLQAGFMEKFVRLKCGEIIGIGWEKEIVRTLRAHFKTKITKRSPVKITPNVVFMGKIQRFNNFEGKMPEGLRIAGKEDTKVKPAAFLPSGEKLVPDYNDDDTAILINTKNGLIIITGCSHSGICNIALCAAKLGERLWKTTKIHAIIGGMHLRNASSSTIRQTAKFLKPLNAMIYACHCSRADQATPMIDKSGGKIDPILMMAEAGLKIKSAYTGIQQEF